MSLHTINMKSVVSSFQIGTGNHRRETDNKESLLVILAAHVTMSVCMHADVLPGCPSDTLMCQDPGLLTCSGGSTELNDCSARGDCKQGRCFCHLGFGGDDCSVPVCTTGCPGVRFSSHSIPTLHAWCHLSCKLLTYFSPTHLECSPRS